MVKNGTMQNVLLLLLLEELSELSVTRVSLLLLLLLLLLLSFFIFFLNLTWIIVKIIIISKPEMVNVESTT